MSRDTHQKRKQKIFKQILSQQISIFVTDAARGYIGLSKKFKHDFVDRAVKYAEGRVYTNGVEDFWCLLDRTIGGTYIRTEAHHILCYVNEQAFRFNHRNGTDLMRFLKAIQ